MDRDELARVIEEAEIAAGCFTVPAVRLAVADAIASWFREYLGKEETVEAVAEAICDHTREMHRYEDLDAHNRRFWQEHARAALISIAGK